MKTKRAILVKPEKFEIVEVEENPGPDQVLVKIASCGLCSWELNHWKGALGTCPQPLGHEFGGTIVEIGKNITEFKVGDAITTLPSEQTGFSEYAALNRDRCFKLTPNVNPQLALGEPLKCVVTVLRGTAPEAGDSGVILGCGPMGLWCIQALSGNYLSSLIAVDVDDAKLALALKFGATHVINPKKEDAYKRIEEITGGLMADFVIEGTGIPSMMDAAQHYLKHSGRGRLILMSSHEETSPGFDFRVAIKKAIDIRVPHWRYSHNSMEDMRRAVAYLNNGVFKLDEVVSHRFSLEHIQEAFETLENRTPGYIKGIVIP